MARTCKFAAHLGNFALLALNVFFRLALMTTGSPRLPPTRTRSASKKRDLPTSDLNAVQLEPGGGPGKLRLAVNSGTSCELPT